MKSIFLAPALISFIHGDAALEPPTDAKPLPELVALAQVIEERPIVELQAPPPFVPVVAKEEDRLGDLKKEMEALAENLRGTQQAVENVAKQRDEAREEVRALSKANHEMLAEMKEFRKELELAREEAGKWKEHAAAMERKANDQALANAALQQFRAELQGAMKDFEEMKGDMAKARAEFVDPIERANLKQELAKAKANEGRLKAEIEMALVAREKTIRESEQTRKELEGKMGTLMKQAKRAGELEDGLRSANAVKMKALADVEVLRKQLTRSETSRGEALASLETAQNGLTALQAEKAAALEARAVAMQERDAVRADMAGVEAHLETAHGEIEQTREELAAIRKEAAEAAQTAKAAEEARAMSDRKLADTAGVLDKTKEEIEFLTKAKGGLEELLFRKTAEIRKLKGELRKEQASRDESSDPPAEKTEDGEAERATAKTFAD